MNMFPLARMAASARAAQLQQRRAQDAAEVAIRNSLSERDQMAQRRIKASHEWIEDTIAVAQRRGLTPTKVSHYADGSIEVHLGGDAGVKSKARQGWDI